MNHERIDNLPTDTLEGYRTRPGKPLPFGVSHVPGGLNFSIYTSAGTACTLVLFSRESNLCLAEKLVILQADPVNTLNKRSELTGKCQHKNKFKLKNLT